MDVRGKTILVTGAGRGIGRSLAVHFARKGANLALLDTNADDVDETRVLCSEEKIVARIYVADAANEDSVVGALDQVTSDFGRLDGLINNAGIVRDAMLVKVKDGQVVGKMTLAQWQAVIDVNLTGVFLCAREAAQRMIALTGGGVIVNVSSISRAGNPGQTNYSAAKAGVESMTVVWAKELARYGIRVGAVAPGFTHTDGRGHEARSARQDDRAGSAGASRRAEEIAHAVGFIFENDFFTGRCVEVDAGLRM